MLAVHIVEAEKYLRVRDFDIVQAIETLADVLVPLLVSN